MKMLIIAATALVSTLALGKGLPSSASYKGHGQWKDASGKTGEYQVATKFEAGRVCADYTWEGGNRSFCFDIAADDQGFLAIENGWGYCYDYQCHYEVKSDDFQVEETLTFVDNNLYKLGSKVVSGSRIVWQESLAKQTGN